MKFLLGYFIVGIPATNPILEFEKVLKIEVPKTISKWGDLKWKRANLTNEGICTGSSDTSSFCCFAKDTIEAGWKTHKRTFKYDKNKNMPCCLNAAINEQIGHQVAAADYLYNMAYSASTVSFNLPNLSKFLHIRAGKERELANKFADFQTTRGGIVTLPTKREYLIDTEQSDNNITSILNQIEEYEKKLIERINQLLKNYSGEIEKFNQFKEASTEDYIMELAERCKAPHLEDLLTSEVIPARIKSLFQIKSLINQFKIWEEAGDNQFHFDEEIISEYV